MAQLIVALHRHLKECGNWDQSLSLAELALGILKQHKSEMAEQYADILMSLPSSYHCLGNRVKGLQYAEAHFKQRMLVQEAKPAAERDYGFTAMAYTELSLARLMNDDYDDAIALAVQGRRLLEQTPEFLNRTYWPHWADYHHAWSLIGLDRAEEARPILQNMLEWRRQTLQSHETESMKWVVLYL